MPLWIWIALGWSLYRKWRDEPIIPAIFEDAFARGAMLVKTETGHLVAVPADTPIKDPLIAASDGDLNPDASAAVIFGSADQPAQVLMGGFGDPWNPDAGVGDDWEPGLYGLLRSTSISARRRV